MVGELVAPGQGDVILREVQQEQDQDQADDQEGFNFFIGSPDSNISSRLGFEDNQACKAL